MSRGTRKRTCNDVYESTKADEPVILWGQDPRQGKKSLSPESLEHLVLRSGNRALKNMVQVFRCRQSDEISRSLPTGLPGQAIQREYRAYEHNVRVLLSPHWHGPARVLKKQVRYALKPFRKSTRLLSGLLATPFGITAAACLMVLLGGYHADGAIAPINSKFAGLDIPPPAGTSVHLSRQMIFVDATLPDRDRLLQGAPAGAQVVLLQPSGNLIGQMVDHLLRSGPADALHLFTHGAPGRLLLGTTVIDQATLRRQASQLELLGTLLAGSRDIFLYGCEVAAGREGSDFVRLLATLTDGDVAASTDLTGTAKRGGDWELELVAGRMNDRAIASGDYSGLLAAGQVIAGDGSGGGGGGSKYAGGGSGGAGGGDADIFIGTAGDDIFFGDGSGGGGGGSKYAGGGGSGGAGGGGTDTLNGGLGNDILFGDGFSGSAGVNSGGAGGFGGGGGGGANGYFTGLGIGGAGGIGAGGGGGGYRTNGGNGGFGGGGGGAGGGRSRGFGGGFGATDGAANTGGYGGGGGGGGYGGGSGGSHSWSGGNGGIGGGASGGGNGGNCGGNWYDGGGGGGGFGGGSGGTGGAYSAGTAGGAGPTTQISMIDDAGQTIYNSVKAGLGSLVGKAGGAGDDLLDGGPGSDDLFGMGGTNTFVFESDDAVTGSDIDTVWDWNTGTANLIELKTGGATLTDLQVTAIVAAQTPSGSDRAIVHSDGANQVSIVVKGIGRDLTVADFVFNPGAPVAGFGNGIQYDGANDYVLIPRIDTSGGSALTLEAWVRPLDITTNIFYEIIRQNNTTTGIPDHLLSFQSHGAILSFGIRTSTSYKELDVPIMAADFTDGNWHHVAATYDGATQRLYVDGSEVGNQPHTGANQFEANSVQTIGAVRGNSGFQEYFNGSIDEVRVWNIARGTTEVRQGRFDFPAGTTPGLVARWHFDEGSGTAAADVSVSGYDGTLTNGPVWIYTAGRTIGAIETNEDNGYSGIMGGYDIDGVPLTYSIVSDGTLGSAVFTDPATGAFTYTPGADLNGSDSFTYKVNDGADDSATVTVTMGIAAVNDDPAISGLPTDITVTEDTASNVDLNAASLSDVDSGANDITLTIAAGAGTLISSSGGGVTVSGSGTGTLSLTGTVANTDTFLNIAANIQYTGAANAAGNDATTLTITVNDGGNTGFGGGGNVALGTVNVDITGVNDAPIFTDTPAISGTAAVGNTLSLTGTGTSDVDGDTVTLTYQWQVDGIAIAGANGATYVVTAAEAHKTITCALTADDGNSGTANTTTAGVGVANSAPAFTATPAISGTAAVGSTLSLTGTGTDDVDGDTVTLTYQWQADGVNIGGATSATYVLTAAEAHTTITCTVMADDGNTGTANATTAGIGVANSAPIFTGTPAISGTAAVGSTLSLTGTGTDDVDGDTVTLTYQWQADGVDIGGANGATYVLTASEAHKTITCALTADDGNSGTANATTAGIGMANAAPAFTGTPAISGTAAVGNTLSLIGTGTSDADGDTVTLSYQWQADGADIGGANAATCVLTASEAHKTITCTVTADDGNGGSVNATTAGAGMANTAPTFTGTPAITGTAAVGSTLSLTGTGTDDIDGDTVTLTYQWQADGVDIGGANGATYVLTASEAHKTITCALTADDGNSGTANATTAGIGMANAVPAFTATPAISGTAAVGNTLSLIGTGTSDADGDTVTLTYQWQADGADIGGANAATCVLTASEAHKTITCTVMADDGNGGSVNATTAGAGVANTAPTFTGTPAVSGTAAVGNTLSLSGTGTSDADGDTVTLTYQWQADGIAIGGANGATYVVTAAEAHKTITCALTADDGNSGTANATTAGVGVANTAPTFTGTPAISGSAAVGNTLSLTGTGTSDADGDTVTLTYQWQADGVDISGANGATYVLTASEAHTTITCALTADDGNSGTANATTAGIGMANAAPAFTGTPAISGTAAVGNTLSLTGTGTVDGDGDTVTLTYQWQADGVDIGGANGATYVLTASEAHTTITCALTADDGNSGTANATTAGVGMANTAPAFTDTPAITGTAAVGNALSLSGTGTSDADGDTVTLSYQWQADGADIGGATADTYTVTPTDKGKTLSCTLTAEDEKGGVDTFTTAGLRIGSFRWQFILPELTSPIKISGGGR